MRATTNGRVPAGDACIATCTRTGMPACEHAPAPYSSPGLPGRCRSHLDSATPRPRCGTVVLFPIGPAVGQGESRRLRTATPTRSCGRFYSGVTIEDARRRGACSMLDVPRAVLTAAPCSFWLDGVVCLKPGVGVPPWSRLLHPHGHWRGWPGLRIPARSSWSHV